MVKALAILESFREANVSHYLF